VLSCKFSREVANLTKPMQLYQDPFPAGWTRIVYTSIHDTLITLNNDYGRRGRLCLSLLNDLLAISYHTKIH